MPSINRLLTVVATTLAIAAISAAATAGDFVGKAFPNFSATDPISGKKFSLKDFQGKVVIIDFWATWCGPCVKELPNVKKAYGKYKDQGLVIISISLDSDKNRFKQFVKRNKMDWHHVMDGGRWKTRLAKKYGINSIPKMFVLDHEGNCISDSARGAALERAVKTAIANIPEDGLVEKTEPEPAAMNIAIRRELRGRIEESQRLLTAGAKPLNEFQTRLGATKAHIETLAGSITSARDYGAVRTQYEQIHTDLKQLRQDMFLCGLINDRRVTLPENPYARRRVDERRALIAVGRQMEPAKQTVDGLNAAVASALESYRNATSDAEAMGRRISRKGADPDRMTAEADKILSNAIALNEQCCDPWKTQLRVVDEALKTLAGASPSVTRSIEQAEGNIERCRRLLTNAGRRDMASVRDQMDHVCNSMEALIAEMTRAGMLKPGEAAPPKNHLKGRLGDSRARIDTVLELDKAEKVIATARRSFNRAGADVERFTGQIREMQAELDKAGDDEAKLADLERRFTALTITILNYLDSSARS